MGLGRERRPRRGGQRHGDDVRPSDGLLQRPGQPVERCKALHRTGGGDTPASRIASSRTADRFHNRTSKPRRTRSAANAHPTLPAPITATLGRPDAMDAMDANVIGRDRIRGFGGLARTWT